ncbi:hypothetical protein [Paenibacillus sacheonensis]|uniref:Uncharacterized protein n=1 Tax=Paenibacillus sacheonensis TaxID=742054 RepID=A0A7X5C0E7_9BACL|nr:hypothetical protein [Paenibacillus sacheonensis]MBM7564639.1 hypothetical protein [Paenibacillus sacheonensis]NBC69195.1 hypothetical protein [Paenibacillus sacheonensis]
MAYKPLDFQISIPRTPDHASQQNQLNHRPMAEQTMLEQASVKQSDLQRSRNSAVEQSGNQGITQNRSRESSLSKRKRQRNPEREESEQSASDGPSQAAHPYKGKHIDFTL